MPETQRQNYIKGAAVLAAASMFVKVISATFQIPLVGILGSEGAGHFQMTHNIFMMFLTIASAGVPVALSRMISSAANSGNAKLVKRYFAVSMPAFVILGAVVMALMFFFADTIAFWQNNSLIAPGIRVLAPAVFFICIISVYRGFMQGLEYMMPTAVSQIVDVVCRAVIGIATAILLSRALFEPHIVSAGATTGITIGLGLSIPLLILYKRKANRLVPEHTSSEPLPSRGNVLGNIIKVSVPITLGASVLTVMTVLNQTILAGRLQSVFGYTEAEASYVFGMYTMAMRVYNLPPAIFVSLAVALVPAIAGAIAGKRPGEAKAIMQSSLKLVNLIAMPAAAGMMILASPILIALFEDPDRLTAQILIILGVASFLLCLQIVTTAILQANGHERLAMMVFPIGAVVKLLLTYFLVAVPNIGILASPISTLACFVVLSILNFIIIRVKIKDRPKYRSVLLKPLICTSGMSVVAFFLYRLLFQIGSGILGTGRSAVILYLAATMIVAMIVYCVLIVLLKAITLEDLKLIPKGEKIAKFLKITQ